MCRVQCNGDASWAIVESPKSPRCIREVKGHGEKEQTEESREPRWKDGAARRQESETAREPGVDELC